MPIIGLPLHGLKTCAGCQERKPRSEFHRFVRAKDGLTPRCKPCVSAANRVYREKHRDLVLAGKKCSYRVDLEKSRATRRAWKERNRERHQFLQRRSWLKQMYNMTPEQYDALLTAQNNACALCDKSADERRLAVDHDHNCCPGKRSCGRCVRGLLCTQCNRLLGWVDARRERIDNYCANSFMRKG